MKEEFQDENSWAHPRCKYHERRNKKYPPIKKKKKMQEYKNKNLGAH